MNRVDSPETLLEVTVNAQGVWWGPKRILPNRDAISEVKSSLRTSFMSKVLFDVAVRIYPPLACLVI